MRYDDVVQNSDEEDASIAVLARYASPNAKPNANDGSINS
jgi:hypothetical protein